MPGDEQVRFLFSLQTQGGGDNLGSARNYGCSQNYSFFVYYTCGNQLEHLAAGDGTGFEMGVLLPLNDGLELELAGGVLWGRLDNNLVDDGQDASNLDDYTAKIRRYQVRAQVFFRSDQSMRWGVGAVGHLSGRYKQASVGISQAISDTWGARFQMDWMSSDESSDYEIRYGLYIQNLSYDIEGLAFEQSAESIGFIASFYFR